MRVIIGVGGDLIDRFRNRFRLRRKCIRWRDEVCGIVVRLVVVVGRRRRGWAGD